MNAIATAPTWTWAIPLIVGIIALAGVTATAFIAYANMDNQIRSAHKLKIVEMRQAWINNLRDAMASFQSYGVTPNLPHDASREFYEMGTRIELFMNPNAPDYAELQGYLYKFLLADSTSKKFAANAPFIAVCQRILKREWEVLKRELKQAKENQ